MRLLAVIDGQRMGFSRFGMYMLAVPLHGDRRRAAPHPLETSDVGWFADGALPGGDRRAQWWGPMAFAAIAASECPATFDPVRSPVWRRSRHSVSRRAVAEELSRPRRPSASGSSASSRSTGVVVVVVIELARHSSARRRPALERRTYSTRSSSSAISGGDPGVVLGGGDGEPVDAAPACRSSSRPARRGPSPPSVRGSATRTRAPPPTATPWGSHCAERVVQHTDDARRTLVVRRCEVEALDQSASVAVPISCIGGWGTSASSAPSDERHASPRIDRRCRRSARRTAASAVRARGRARAPRRYPAARPTRRPTVGHTIDRGASSSRRTCGRTVAKSVNTSGSISARATLPTTRSSCGPRSRRRHRRRSSR